MKFLTIFFSSVIGCSIANANMLQDITYCKQHGGNVKYMTAQYDTHTGYVNGWKKGFCTFNIEGTLTTIGLKTFASKKANLAATFIKKLPKDSISKLWVGSYSNPSLNLCKNLGGSEIVFNVIDGGFTDHYGQSDICVFGDGSMVSAWSLTYMALYKSDYTKITNAIRSMPLNIDMQE